MDRIEHLWILVSNDFVCCCNESIDKGDAEQRVSVMESDFIFELITLARNQGWQCTIVANRNGIPQALCKHLERIKYRIIVPADYNGESLGMMANIVFDCEQACLGDGPSSGKAILRVSQGNIDRLATCVIKLLNRYADVSIKHPDLLKYTEKDLKIYKEQLYKVGEWLLNKGSSWSDFRVDVLTDRFRLNDMNECGAGDRSLAVGPDGSLYLCPAAFRGGFDPCGHIFRGVEIANRHLFTRKYALSCRDKCDALHCSRCVFLNKLATFEFCVPAENVCKLAHIELESQAWLANEAVKQNLWNGQEWETPLMPIIDDPFQLVKVEEDIRDTIWSRLLLFTGRPEDLSPSMMLDIICSLEGRLDAILSCFKSGHIVSSDLIENNVLLYLRRKTVERYKNIIFKKGCPTVYEIEMLMHRMVETLTENRS